MSNAFTGSCNAIAAILRPRKSPKIRKSRGKVTNIAIVGFGYWGRNLVRNFSSVETCNLLSVCEQREAGRELLNKSYPSIETTGNFQDLLENPDIQGIVIATPVDTHYGLAKQALKAGKHVLVEKPLCDDYDNAKELLALAQRKNLTLMVDHTFLYTGAVRKIKKLVEGQKIGDIQYIDSTRINLGLFQHDVNVLWDLAPHDISICSYVLGKQPLTAQAVGVSHTENDIENIAYLTLKYEKNLIAHFTCSWVSPVKIRQMLIGGTEKMILYNDMEPTEKLKIYDTGYSAKTAEDRRQLLVDYRTGDIHVPKIETTEALSLMAQDFVDAIKTGKRPESTAELGLSVVQILAAAQESIKQNGKEVIL